MSRIYECILCGERNGNISRNNSFNSINKIMNGRCLVNLLFVYIIRFPSLKRFNVYVCRKKQMKLSTHV